MKTAIYVMIGLMMISSAFALTFDKAKSICDTATTRCVVLPEGANGFTPIVTNGADKVYQAQLVKNNADFNKYVNWNINNHLVTFYTNKNEQKVAVIDGKTDSKIDVYIQRTSEGYTAMGTGFETLPTAKDKFFPPIDVRVEKEPYRPSKRTLEFDRNYGGDMPFGFNPNIALFGSNVVVK